MSDGYETDEKYFSSKSMDNECFLEKVFSEEKEISIMTCNCFVLPKGVTSKGLAIFGHTDYKDFRIRCLETYLFYTFPQQNGGENIDIICCQELFDIQRRNQLIETAKQYGYYDFHDSQYTNLGNGLLILSVYPFDYSTKFIGYFRDQSKLSADYFVRKGAIFCDILINNDKNRITIGTFHPQSSNGDSNFATRVSNLTDLSLWLRKMKKNNPLILAGDANMNSKDPQQKCMMESVLMQEFSDTCCSLHFNDPEKIDCNGEENYPSSFQDTDELLDYIMTIENGTDKSKILHKGPSIVLRRVFKRTYQSHDPIPISDHNFVMNRIIFDYRKINNDNNNDDGCHSNLSLLKHNHHDSQ